MSTAVPNGELERRVEEYGSSAFLVTVNPDSAPHVVAITVDFADGCLHTATGHHSSANAAERPGVSVLWPSGSEAGYCLIVDGISERLDADSPSRLLIRPTGAVLHRTPEGDTSGPSCITVLPRS